MIARDHTRLIVRENKLWRFQDIPLPGIVIPRLIIGGAGGGLIVLLFILAGNLLGNPILTLVGMLIGAAVGGFLYWIAGRTNADQMTLYSQLSVTLDWLLRQPKTINGFTRDLEPDQINYQIITWDPTTEQWRDRFTATLHHITKD